MGIRYTKFRTYRSTVTVEEPSATEADKVEKVSFVAIFNRPTREQLEKHHATQFESEDAKVNAFLGLTFVGAEGFEGEDGKPLSVDEGRAIVVNDFAYTMAVIDKFNNNFLGEKKGN